MSAHRVNNRRTSRSGLAAAFAITVALVAGLLTATPAVAAQQPIRTAAAQTSSSIAAADLTTASVVNAADLSRFQPGNIISDAVFFNKGTMSEAQIQAFLQARVPSCQSGYVCLKDAYDTSRTTSADAMCGAYSGGVRERASRIIYKVAQACGINPQVILATLQKEQGLVTHTWPSDWRYTIAMGQGCPDTAACDTRYYGFFNQVYGAAWQLKRYANPPGTSNYFNWYAPGKTWNVRFHPNAACGSTPVHIQNQATANLYYYTPYQPNAASIRAYSGEGDGCSSYGNRNFYRFFTEWFGSTQSGAGPLFAVGKDIYLVSDRTRYHILPAVWPEYRRVFGEPTSVDSNFLSGVADGGRASLFIHDNHAGTVAYLQDGESHRFPTCAVVAVWGGNCGSLTRLAGSDFDRIRAGGGMTMFARVAAGGPMHLIEGKVLAPYFDTGSAAAANGGRMPYAPVMPESLRGGYSVGALRFAPASFIELAGSTQAWIPSTDSRLLHLPSWSVAEELGLPTTAYRKGVDPSVVSSFIRQGVLELFVRCGDQTLFGSRGVLHPVASAATDGFTISQLDVPTCAGLRRGAAGPLPAVFVRGADSTAVYLAEGGRYRHVTSPALLRELGGGAAPTVLLLSGVSANRLPKGEPIRSAAPPTAAPTTPPTSQPVPDANLASGKFFTDAGSQRVYLPISGTEALYLPSWALAAELGLPTTSSTTIDQSRMSAIREVGVLSSWASCEGVTYFASQGTLFPVSTQAAAGFSVAPVDTQTCRMLVRSGAEPLQMVFVSAVGDHAVYSAQNGVLRHVTSPTLLTTLGGGTWPPVMAISSVTLGRFTLGSPLTAATD